MSTTTEVISAMAVSISAITAIWALISSYKIANQSNKTAKASLKLSEQSRDTSKHHMQFIVFTECTRRFHEIKLHLREECTKEDKDYYRRLYIDLCSEEFFLESKGYLYKEIWEVWSEGMKLNVNEDQDYKKIWETDKGFYDEKFRDFFDSFFENDNTK
jgi:hypothetical protein